MKLRNSCRQHLPTRIGLPADWPSAVVDADGDLAIRCAPGKTWEVDVRYRQQAWDAGHHGGNQSLTVIEDATDYYQRRWVITQGSSNAMGYFVNFIFQAPPRDVNAVNTGWAVQSCYGSACWSAGAPIAPWSVGDGTNVAIRIKRNDNYIASYGSTDGGKTFPTRIYQKSMQDPASSAKFDLQWIALCDGNQGGYTAYSWVKLRKVP